MTTSPKDDRAAAERRAWAEDEFKVYPPGAKIPAPPVDDDDQDDEGADEE